MTIASVSVLPAEDPVALQLLSAWCAAWATAERSWSAKLPISAMARDGPGGGVLRSVSAQPVRGGTD